MNATTAPILDCGHEPSPHGPHDTGYGIDYRTEKTRCYACCAEQARDEMISTGRATLYLSRDDEGAWNVGNWPGSLSFPARDVRVSRHGGGFGASRTDARFTGPDGFVWTAVQRGVSNTIARCKRTAKREPTPTTRLACGHRVEIAPDGGEGCCPCIRRIKRPKRDR